jgi:hypothetical protein
VLQDYRNAVAGGLITIAAWASSSFGGVEIPAEVGAAAVTIVVFALGFLPKPKHESGDTSQ